MSSRIESRPDVMFGKPCVRGTRIPVEVLLRKLAGGTSPGELLLEYPRLELADIHAALEFAAERLRDGQAAK